MGEGASMSSMEEVLEVARRQHDPNVLRSTGEVQSPQSHI